MTHDLSVWVKKVLLLLLILTLLYLLYSITSILVIILIAGFITVIVNPLIDKWERYHIPVWVMITLVYISVFFLGSVIISTILPIVTDYISAIVRTIIEWANKIQEIYTTQWGLKGFHLNPYVEKVVILLFWEANINHTLDIIKQNAGNIQAFFTNQISSLTSGGISIVSTVGGVVTEWIIIAVTTFLMVLERREVGNFILKVSPKKTSMYLHTHYLQIQHVGSSWIRWILTLCLSIFLMTYIGLTIVQFVFGFQVPQSFSLALISGIMEFVPYAGPFISFTLAVIIWLGISWKAALILGFLYLIIQQIEGNFMVPYVMSKSLNLSPFFVFIIMLVGASLGGILGVILAVPIAGICKVVYSEYMKNREDNMPIEDPVHIKRSIKKQGRVIAIK